jgi:hypothetical protein
MLYNKHLNIHKRPPMHMQMKIHMLVSSLMHAAWELNGTQIKPRQPQHILSTELNINKGGD